MQWAAPIPLRQMLRTFAKAVNARVAMQLLEEIIAVLVE
jgi:hypothetical protein